MRLTHATVPVAIALLQNPETKHYGYELSKAAGVRSGVMYPLLRRMLNEELLIDGWEDAAKAAAEGRPPRRYYVLTDQGRQQLGGMVRSAEKDNRFRGLDFSVVASFRLLRFGGTR